MSLPQPVENLREQAGYKLHVSRDVLRTTTASPGVLRGRVRTANGAFWFPVIIQRQAKEREGESKERLSLLEEQMSVKDKAVHLMEIDMDKVRACCRWTAGMPRWIACACLFVHFEPCFVLFVGRGANVCCDRR